MFVIQVPFFVPLKTMFDTVKNNEAVSMRQNYETKQTEIIIDKFPCKIPQYATVVKYNG